MTQLYHIYMPVVSILVPFYNANSPHKSSHPCSLCKILACAHLDTCAAKTEKHHFERRSKTQTITLSFPL